MDVLMEVMKYLDPRSLVTFCTMSKAFNNIAVEVLRDDFFLLRFLEQYPNINREITSGSITVNKGQLSIEVINSVNNKQCKSLLCRAYDLCTICTNSVVYHQYQLMYNLFALIPTFNDNIMTVAFYLRLNATPWCRTPAKYMKEMLVVNPKLLALHLSYTVNIDGQTYEDIATAFTDYSKGVSEFIKAMKTIGSYNILSNIAYTLVILYYNMVSVDVLSILLDTLYDVKVIMTNDKALTDYCGMRGLSDKLSRILRDYYGDHPRPSLATEGNPNQYAYNSYFIESQQALEVKIGRHLTVRTAGWKDVAKYLDSPH